MYVDDEGPLCEECYLKSSEGESWPSNHYRYQAGVRYSIQSLRYWLSSQSAHVHSWADCGAFGRCLNNNFPAPDVNTERRGDRSAIGQQPREAGAGLNKRRIMIEEHPSVIAEEINEDICWLCGEPGSDKYPHPVHWPGEQIPDTEFVHALCEAIECNRAFLEFRQKVGDSGVREFLRNI
jgi:hypothetical protein